ncbi:MAG: ABC transporter ATP-binding protein [Phycisphaerales bacterium]
MPAIELENLTRRYGARRGVEGVSLRVPAGMLFGFLGPNGAGKTTTIRVLLGLLSPTAGAARVLGYDCWRDGPRIKRELGYLPGDLRLYPWLNGLSALRMVGRIRGLDLLPAGRALAEEFALDLRVKVRAMSRGTRQKLGLLLAMAHNPRILILDEPTASLDPLMQRTLHARLRRMAAAGATVFFSSHTLSEVEELCQRVAIVREGRIVADETLEELRRSAGHEVTIRWGPGGGGPPPEPPPFLGLDRREPREWHGLLTGPVAPLLEWLRGRDIADLTIGRPDLETLFRTFYEGGEERHGRADAVSGTPVFRADGTPVAPVAPAREGDIA